MSRFDGISVEIRKWRIDYLDVQWYGGGGIGKNAFERLFPELPPSEDGQRLDVEGRRLMEASALIHQTEECHLLRYADADLPLTTLRTYADLSSNQPLFIASNVDLQMDYIDGTWRVVTTDRLIAGWLSERFPDSKIVEE